MPQGLDHPKTSSGGGPMAIPVDAGGGASSGAFVGIVIAILGTLGEVQGLFSFAVFSSHHRCPAQLWLQPS